MSTNDSTSWAEIHNRHGVPEVYVQWVANNASSFRIIDVREPSEVTGPLGTIEDAENVPLRDLARVAADWDRHAPMVIYCRSGGRSGQAAITLLQMGFTKVASMAGGMLEWHALHMPVA